MWRDIRIVIFFFFFLYIYYCNSISQKWWLYFLILQPYISKYNLYLKILELWDYSSHFMSVYCMYFVFFLSLWLHNIQYIFLWSQLYISQLRLYLLTNGILYLSVFVFSFLLFWLYNSQLRFFRNCNFISEKKTVSWYCDFISHSDYISQFLLYILIVILFLLP